MSNAYVYVDIKLFLPPWGEVKAPAQPPPPEDEGEQSKGFQALASVLERGMYGTQSKPSQCLISSDGMLHLTSL